MARNGAQPNGNTERAFHYIDHPKKRAFLTAYALLGNKRRAAQAADVERTIIYSPQWRNDEEFQEALEDARIMAADVLEDEAHRRAMEGTRSYKFDKDGIPLRHPDECECGHQRTRHVPRPRGAGQTGSLTNSCTTEDCGCEGFTGTPYYEHAYSDTLLIFLTKGALPERYREIREVRGMLAKLDLNLLPNNLIQRIAQGEPIESVLAAGASEAGITPGELVRGALAPGPPPGDSAQG